jgi:hypothetical protein
MVQHLQLITMIWHMEIQMTKTSYHHNWKRIWQYSISFCDKKKFQQITYRINVSKE